MIRVALPVGSLVLVLVVASSGCSSVETFLTGDKVDYRSASTKTQPLEVPPDLTQLSRDTRFQPQAGSISASTYGQAASAPLTAPTPTVAPPTVGDVRIERDGTLRWLYTPMPPEQLWPQLLAFWQERGFTIAYENRETGMIETEWAENRAKIPEGGLRALLGRALDTLYSTGERDKFRIRVEQSPRGGSEVSITHRGMVEVYTNVMQDTTKWQPRPPDPQLEAEFLSRLMVKLGTPPETAKTAAANPVPPPAAAASAPRARLVAGGAALQIDDSFDRAWRRVGLALDRSGFTVEDRDRGAGLYYVRYVRPEDVGKEEPGFFSRLFGSKDGPQGPARYRVALKSEAAAATTMVSVQDAQGAPETSEAGRRIVALLIDDLK